MDRKTLLIIATCDTKGREAAFLRDCAVSLGVPALIMDVGTLGEPQTKTDISSDAVAGAAGYGLGEIRAARDRVRAVKAVQEGGILTAGRLLTEGILGGVIGMGGGTGTAIVTAIMRSLPFGLPKVVVSTVASRDISQYIGTKDIVMFHSVADILGFNGFIRLLLGQAVHAVCGMMARGSVVPRERSMVGVTAYGINSECAIQAEPLLEARGYEMIGFHANGCGGMAMEELIGEGLIRGVLDFTPHEIADEMFGGYCKGIGQARFETAGKKGVPLLLAPGGLDNAVFSPFYPMPESLAGRRTHSHDVRFCVRMGPEEMRKFAGILAEKLNRSAGPSYVLIPGRGWSEADKEGMELYDPATDQVFVDEMRRLLKEGIPMEVMDVHISDPRFAARAVEIIDTMIRAPRSGS